MRIEWDERKRLANIEKHGFDFAELTMAFFADATILPAQHRRYMAIGAIGVVTVSVVFSNLGSEALSVISMRRSSLKERVAAR